MPVGARVVKTVIAIAISITIARWFQLEPTHFAGVISMLAVQPSVFRSIKHSVSHCASALFAAVLAIAAAQLFGNGSVTIAVVVFIVMAIHVKLKRTFSLTLAVIIAINTMGTSDELGGNAAAYHHLLLVLIGISVGTLVNAVHRPMHREREEKLLAKSEGMLRALLYYIQFDLQAGRITPYKPDMRRQIEEIRSYIQQGKKVAGLIREDQWLGRKNGLGANETFARYETMAERIRDLVKALQKADLAHPERKRLIRVIGIIASGQERLIVTGRRPPFPLLYRSLQPSERTAAQGDLLPLIPYYQAYEALSEYLKELQAEKDTALHAAHSPTKVTRRSAGLAERSV